MDLDQIAKWKPFIEDNGNVLDLSFCNAHNVKYTHRAAGKEDICYEFLVTYSSHCFTKSCDDSVSISKYKCAEYDSGKEIRPFCYRRYKLAKTFLRQTIEQLGDVNVCVQHAGYGSYAASKVCIDGEEFWYFVSFKVYRYKKKFRLHITSAYPKSDRPNGAKVGFFKIAHSLKNGKNLPKPAK